jgi:UDP-GlcNAc:undecaprenyl-phosphate GlcNAc-1-phosphate transferase
VQQLLWAPLTSFLVALALVAWLLRSKASAYLIDRPNSRSLHASPVPRTGGIGVLAGVVCGWLVFSPPVVVSLWGGLALLVLISFIDDARGLPVAIRLIVHLAVAAGLSGTTMLPDHGVVAALVAALAIAWMTNLYNFMDGADGLAGGMTAIGFVFYAIAAGWAGAPVLCGLSLCVAAAATAFLVFNFHPARVFLGDAGSIPLGFLAGAFGLLGWLERIWPWWFPLLVFSAFVVDASVTLVRRFVRRERIWQAHRDHFYQRLVRMGWGHRRTALAEYALMVATGALGLAGISAGIPLQSAALLSAGAGYGVIAILIERAWRCSAAEGTR